MKTNRFFACCSAVVAICALGASAAGAQQPYPNKPIRLIVPFPPGGGTDILARVVAHHLTMANKWTVVVENRPGAGGNIGVDAVAKAAPDGYTMVIGQASNLAINPSLYPKLPYDPLKDLAPVVAIASAPVVLVTSSNSNFKTIADIVAAAKAKPGGVVFASPGNGTVSHLTGEMLQRAAGIKFQHIPYKGANQALNDLTGNQVNLFMSSVPTALGQIKSGRLHAIAVSSAKRAQDLPNVPTINESGYKGFDAATWFGFLVPSGTPAPIINTLNTEIDKALQAPAVREKIASEGGEVMGGTPEQFAAFIKSEIGKWGQVVKESGAKVD
jgi:tripartite-type tricarboxylate transporter receptor subunit TctC